MTHLHCVQQQLKLVGDFVLSAIKYSRSDLADLAKSRDVYKD